MKNAMLLDCTLRDGAYLIDKKFGNTVIHGIIEGLARANIDIIEFGFLQSDGYGEGKTVYKNGQDASRFVPKNKGNALFTVLADCSRYDIDLLDQNMGNTFDAVRVCFFKHERDIAVDFCKKVSEKGYKFFVQPVDILGYSDREMIDLIERMNPLQPYCFSIVDTFGSMYVEDLDRVYRLIDHNLTYESRIGFHSHNNMQMSSALSQEFLRMSQASRNVVVDATVSGMGRGAGNTPTELVAQYMVDKLGYSYDIDALLDLIDTYMPGIRTRCEWGYSTPYFIAGCYSAHVNNISYLSNKNGIVSKDIRYILNKIGAIKRKRYDYDLLESTYTDYLSSDIDDSASFSSIEKMIKGKNVILLVPGKSLSSAVDKIKSLVAERDAVVISVNHIPKHIKPDMMFISNGNRYSYWKNDEAFDGISKIFTSNLDFAKTKDDYVISYKRILKCGWENMDNSTILLLRLLDKLGVKSVGIAGFDGYDYVQTANYSITDMEREISAETVTKINKELTSMLSDIVETKNTSTELYFITPSRFEVALRGDVK